MKINTRGSQQILEEATPLVLARWFVIGLIVSILGIRSLLTRQLSIPGIHHGRVEWLSFHGLPAVMVAASMIVLAPCCFVGAFWRRFGLVANMRPAKIGAILEWIGLVAFLNFLAAMYIQFYVNGFEF